MTLTDTSIGFIGAGNMATALIEGLLARGVPAEHLIASDPASDKLAALAAKGIRTCTDNDALVSLSSVVVLAVKPQVMEAVIKPLQVTLQQHRVLLISIAAGVVVDSLQTWTHPGQAIVRCMPNTPALVGAGASALFANALVTDADKQTATGILEAAGLVRWLESEAQIDAVTALSGSGPAYFFLLMEAMQNAGIRQGLPADVARDLCLQTAFGAAKLALASDVDTAELRRRVTSPGGTTEAAIAQFEAEDFRGLVDRALDRAAARSKELAES